MLLRRNLFRNASRCVSEASTSKEISSDKLVGVIGLEVHAQVSSVSKLFSGAGTGFGNRPNRSVALFDYAAPGTLPVLNKVCVEKGVKTATALNCRINPVSHFDRKHYFYADLPSGYQITQLNKALANNGSLNFHVFDVKHCPDAYEKSVEIHQIQLEQDSGKSIQDTVNSRGLIDLNRAGVGLMEIITGPNFSSGVEAQSFVRELILILKQLQSCDCDMSKGHLRVDANISVRPSGSSTLGVRTEVKNLNSLKFIRKAIDFEVKRQTKLIESGNVVVNETRTFDFKSGKTVPMRDKELKQDYRFMPEPNLLPLRLTRKEIKRIVSEIPVLYTSEKQEWIKMGVPPGESIFILEDIDLCEYFRRCIALTQKAAVPKLTEIVVYTLRYKLINDNLSYQNCAIEPAEVVDLVNLTVNDSITDRTSSKLLSRLYEKEIHSVMKTVQSETLWKISDKNEIKSICESVIKAAPPPAQQSGTSAKLRKRLIREALKLANWRVEEKQLDDEFSIILSQSEHSK